MESVAKALTKQFYDWEVRGRGILLADYACDLEPPFHPFFYHYASTPYIDDGRRPTIVSTIVDFFKGRKEPNITIPAYEEPDIQPYPFEDGELHAFTIVLPKGFKTPAEATLQLLIMLSNCRKPLSYEIHATQTAISIHLVCRTQDSTLVRSQCRAYFPDITLHDDCAYIETSLPENKLTGIIDFSLAEEYIRPLNCAKGFDLDPYIAVFGIMEHLEYGETILLQVLFTQTINTWSKSILSSVTTYRGECFFMDAPEMLPLAKEKVSMPLYAVGVKLAVQAKDANRIYDLLEKTGDCVTMLSRSQSNRLIARDDNEYTFENRFDDVILRQTHRLGMLLNARELATLVHFPSHSIHSEKLVRSVTRTKRAPVIAQGHSFVLGRNINQNKEITVSLSEGQRMRHMHIIGATGTGKSTLLLNLILQDIQQGNGFAVIDPHGDVIETILTIIPASRKNDVVIIDPFDSEYPVRCNILHAQTDIEKELISSDLVALFRRFSTSWGDQMNSVFANAILAFVESSKGGTLSDLRRFLIEKTYRDSFLQTVQDSEIVYYWQKEFPLLKSSSIGPILTKLDAFLRPKVIRNMVSQKESLPIAEFMDTKKVILIKLSQGLIGAENSYLLGALLVSKIHQAAMARQLQSKDTRVPFYLYIDEFQHFITPSMSDILSGARKYQLGLVLVHQSMEQVSKYDNELAHALIANAGTRICFRLGNTDAKKLEDGFSYFTADDLQNLSTGEAIVRVNRAEDDFSLQVQQQAFPTNLQIVRDDILIQSRQKYACSVETLGEKELFTETLPFQEVRPTQQPIDNKVPVNEETEKEKVIPKKPNEKPVEPETKKEQSEHKSLQMMIKLMGESRGYRATLEVPTVDNGKVDVVLEKENTRIACEVSVTTDVTWELHNIQKCLKSNFTMVVSVSKTEKFLANMQKKIGEVCTTAQKMKTLVLSPEGLFQYLDELNKSKEETTSFKGYRVKVKYENDDTDSQQKKELLDRILKQNKKNS